MLSVRGRTFKIIKYVHAFFAHDNAEWLIKKSGYPSPHAMLSQRQLATMHGRVSLRSFGRTGCGSGM